MIADKILNFIDGEYVATDKWYENRNPINNKVIGMVAEAGEKEVDAAVKAAKAALKGPWGSMSLQKRIELLEALVVEINNRFDDFLEAECADTGKPKSMASHVDIPRGAANFKVFADMVKNVPTEFFEMTTPDGGKAINYGYRRPVGVVGVICPWNLPLLLMTWKVGPALACGNTVVVKPSEDTPRTAALLGEVMNKVGIPKGVYNVVNGFGANSAGAFLTAHPDVDALTFTGETRTGEVIMKAAANGSRPVSLEMGGKNAAIVFADCDFDKAIEGTLRSVFLNCGQVCLGTERVYVERPIFDKFVAALKAGAEGMKIGVPDDPAANFGPLVSKKHQEKVLSYYKVAVEEGATVVTGGGVPQMPGELADGCWVQPTIWTGLPETARVIKEEIFGPCCHIAPFDTEEEVLEKANDNKYGLACAIWTQDVSRAHRVAQKME
ncbi:MAG: 2-hydroxymuconic semialdehyde dehydrogenase, partial [Proteobacteria bacterium]|nr:2-hydroxymuconic semialdehyde dehydrogenase [Pseudomonadota bacterium]